MIIIKKGKVVFMINPEFSLKAQLLLMSFAYFSAYFIHAISFCLSKSVIRQIFKGDLIQFCESFTKITLKLPQNSQKPLMYEACDKHNKV